MYNEEQCSAVHFVCGANCGTVELSLIPLNFDPGNPQAGGGGNLHFISTSSSSSTFAFPSSFIYITIIIMFTIIVVLYHHHCDFHHHPFHHHLKMLPLTTGPLFVTLAGAGVKLYELIFGVLNIL